MLVQTDLRAGGYERCGSCGSLIFVQNNVAFNVQVAGVGNIILWGDQHNDNDFEQENDA
jgi:hypothetical protein